MIPNIGSMDRKIRAFVIAPLLVILAIVLHSTVWLMVVLLVLAAVMLVTSAVKICPLYLPFKLSTAKKQARPRARSGRHRRHEYPRLTGVLR